MLHGLQKQTTCSSPGLVVSTEQQARTVHFQFFLKQLTELVPGMLKGLRSSILICIKMK